MITLIVIPLLIGIVGTIIAIKKRNGEWLLMWLVGVLFYAFVGVPINLRNVPDTSYIQQKIINIRGDSQMSGSFFLGYGSIGETQYYFYFKQEDNGYKQHKIDANSATIFEYATEQTACVTYIYHYNHNKWISLGKFLYGVEFQIPPNSITRQFTLP